MITTTGIGSLPFDSIEKAIDYSLQFDIPFYPQLPLKDIKNSMVYEGLDGLNGICIDQDGHISFRNRIESLDSFKIPENLILFVEKVREKKLSIIKYQIVGIQTIREILLANNVNKEFIETEILSFYISKLALIHGYLNSFDFEVLFFVDEPCLGADTKTVASVLEFYKNLGFIDGLHSCGNTSLETLFNSELKFISIDMHLVAGQVFQLDALVGKYHDAGGRIIWGIYDTHHGDEIFPLRTISKVFPGLDNYYVSPSCGLAMSSVPQCSTILKTLQDQSIN